MNAKEFNKIVERRINLLRDGLINKGEEYADEDDRFHNFNRAAEMTRRTPEECLTHFQAKHIVSIMDLVDEIANMEDGEYFVSDEEYIEEKIGDAIAYYVILEAMLKERIRNTDKELLE